MFKVGHTQKTNKQTNKEKSVKGAQAIAWKPGP